MNKNNHFNAKIYLEENFTVRKEFSSIEESMNEMEDIIKYSVEDIESEPEWKSALESVYEPTLKEYLWNYFADFLPRKGENTHIMATSDSRMRGLDFSGDSIECVCLTGHDEIAYRVNTESVNIDWKIGTLEDAIQEAFDWYYAIKNA